MSPREVPNKFEDLPFKKKYTSFGISVVLEDITYFYYQLRTKIEFACPLSVTSAGIMFTMTWSAESNGFEP